MAPTATADNEVSIPPIFAATVLASRIGLKPLEFEERLAYSPVQRTCSPTLIDALIVAVRTGELGELFSEASNARAIGKPKKAV
jgi:hypothetical protein